MGLVAVTGVLRRPRHVRRRVVWGAGAVGVGLALAAVGMGLGGVQARSEAVQGYRDLLVGLEYLQDGKMPEAAAALRDASASLDAATAQLGRPWTQPARLVPVMAQNRTVTAEVLGRAAGAADAAANTLDLVDLDRLQIVNGRIDLVALEQLEAPLASLEQTVDDLRSALDDADSPWLLDAFQSRLGRARDRAEQVAHQALATREVARWGPSVLGAQEPRRYLLAFTNPGEARATSGLIGNWTEITVTDGKIEESGSGRTAELISGLQAAAPVTIDASDEFFARYGPFGAGEPDTTVRPKFWSNVTMSPDMGTVGDTIVQLYEISTGRAIDGVFIIDPAGIAALLSVTGPITVPELDITLSAADVEQFLLIDQYEAPEADREAVLEAVTQATIDRLLGGTLPAPQDLAKAMAPAALEGHVTAWLARPDEQAMLELVGMDGTLPRLPSPDESGPRFDALAVTTDNASGNKIDSFLERTVTYRPVYDPRTGLVESMLEITLTNTAPRTGFDDYVIGNIIGLPTGTNRTLLEVFSPLALRSATLDGAQTGEADIWAQTERGWQVYATFLDLPPGESVTVTMDLAGVVDPDEYELFVRPQALPRPDRLVVDARTSGGDSLVAFEGALGRRSVLSADGVRAWR
jgi:hypothetical protein